MQRRQSQGNNKQKGREEREERRIFAPCAAPERRRAGRYDDRIESCSHTFRSFIISFLFCFVVLFSHLSFPPTLHLLSIFFSIRIEDICVHTIPRIQDHLPNLITYPNRFARTKADIRPSGQHATNANKTTTNLARQTLSSASSACAAPMSPSATPPPPTEEVQYNQFIKEGDVVLLDIVRRSGLGPGGAKSFIRAGPREEIVWGPGEAVAAIVTCGGQTHTKQKRQNV